MTSSGPAAAVARALAGWHRVALAVSGGADSMALLHLAVAVARECPDAPELCVVTVDHGLRPGSAAEAEAVAAVAARLGVGHVTLAWTGLKPTSGVQEAARAARYRLMVEHARAHGLEAIATAHTREDQAETLLMRLARGSGVDGLGGMREGTFRDGVAIVRPLLGVARADLRAHLAAVGASWVEDPSNENPAFERVRWRAAAAGLAGLGLGPAPLAASARRLARASAALEEVTGARAASLAGWGLGVEAHGHAWVDWAVLLQEPEEIRLRLLAALVTAAGGRLVGPADAALERASVGRGWAMPVGRTLGGAVLEAGKAGRVLLTREVDRGPLGEVVVEPGTSVLWDGRFECGAPADAPVGTVVGPLGAEGLAALERAGFERPAVPWRALRALPAFRSGGRLLAVPVLGPAAAGGDGRGGFRARVLWPWCGRGVATVKGP